MHWPNPWPFAAYAAGLSLLWLAIVAGATVDYLQPVLDRALDSIGNTISGESNPRTLFQASAEESGGIDLGATPVLARIVSLGSVAVLAIGLPFGLIQLWRRFRAEPMALLLATGAVAFFATLSLRFAREAWETANRASEFFFIGLAFVLALAVVLAYARLDGRGPPSAPWLGRAALAGLFGLVLAGGAISGWPWDAHMPRPVRAEAAGNAIESESLALSRWAEEHLPEERFAASDADARMLLAPGGVRARAGRHPDVEDILLEQTFTEFDCEGRCSTTPEKGWELPLLRRFNLRFVVADRRRRSFDVTRGYYFSVRPPGGDADQRLRGASVSKFAQIPTATRVFDSGNIVVYDLEGQR